MISEKSLWSMLEVTDFVCRQTDRFASFLIVQDYRWDEAVNPAHTAGDTQSDGIIIVIREGAKNTKTGPRLHMFVATK